jgi:ABC-type branched-subunit amino acid transport system ATPase component
MLEVVREIASTGVTIVMVEHILDVIEGVTQVVFLMDAGRLVATEDANAIRDHPVFREIYLGRSSR